MMKRISNEDKIAMYEEAVDSNEPDVLPPSETESDAESEQEEEISERPFINHTDANMEEVL